MEPDALARRYRRLWTGEAVAIVVFLVLYLKSAPLGGSWPEWIARTYGLGVLIGILVQSIFWWRHKLLLLRANRRDMPPRIAARFRRLKWMNWSLIGAFPLVLMVKASAIGSIWSRGDTWWGIVCITGALLEQINYFHYQLMYDNPYDWEQLRTYRRLRRGTIGKALAAQPARSASLD